MHLRPPSPLLPQWLIGGGSFVGDSLLIVAPIVCVWGGGGGVCVCYLFCYTVLHVLSSFAIILIEKTELNFVFLTEAIMICRIQNFEHVFNLLQ